MTFCWELKACVQCVSALYLVPERFMTSKESHVSVGSHSLFSFALVLGSPSLLSVPRELTYVKCLI